jgi:hypothetical protein
MMGFPGRKLPQQKTCLCGMRLTESFKMSTIKFSEPLHILQRFCRSTGVSTGFDVLAGLQETRKLFFGKRVGNALPAFSVWPQESVTARKRGQNPAKLVMPLDETGFAFFFSAVPGSGSTTTSTWSQGFRLHICGPLLLRRWPKRRKSGGGYPENDGKGYLGFEGFDLLPTRFLSRFLACPFPKSRHAFPFFKFARFLRPCVLVLDFWFWARFFLML